jgi:large subunit ribosomal protein L11
MHKIFQEIIMPKQTIEALVDGGKASAGPPLGPSLGPIGVNIGEVIAAINEKTRDMAGMKVPVKVIVDTDTKQFEIEVGTPPTSALIKKELGLQKASEEPGKKRVADLSPDQVKKIARIKFGSDDDSAFRQVEGAARSMGISVGKGEVTQEEVNAYEETKAAEEAAKAQAEAEKKPAEGEPPEGEEPAKEGEEPEPSEGKEEKPKEKKEES